MSDLAALLQYREQPLFSDWVPDVPDDRIAVAVDTIKRLIDDVLVLGDDPQEADVRSAVSACGGSTNLISWTLKAGYLQLSVRRFPRQSGV